MKAPLLTRGIEVRPFDLSNATHARAFRDFVVTHYGPQTFLADLSYVQWWFSEVLGFWMGSELAAINAHIQAPVRDRIGHLQPMHWMANTMVAPRFRRGLGLQVVSESIQRYGEVGTIAFNSGSRPVLQALGFEIFCEQTFERWILERPEAHATAAALEPCSAVEAAAVWASARTRYGIATERSVDYLNWRYRDHPSRAYRMQGVRDARGDWQAIIVLRTEPLPASALRVIDLFGTKPGIEQLLPALSHSLSANPPRIVDFIVSRSPDAEALIRSGWRRLASETEKAAVPFLFHPPASDRPFLENLGLALSAETRLSRSWDDYYWVKGDADRDRPPSQPNLPRSAGRE